MKYDPFVLIKRSISRL